ncbi:hypothetical protein K2Z84_27710 [Candidatus Binatia bacterium]|nr:hypothetical protein [Candidatus Binatia bacterium]
MNASRRPLVRLVLCFAAAIVLIAVGSGAWFVVSHRHVVAASPRLADSEFAALRARFADQQPLLDTDRRDVSAASGPQPRGMGLRSFHTVVYDTRGGERLVEIAVPYWFARRFADRNGEFTWLGQLTFLDDTEFDPEAIRLSLAQLERRGPGLVADFQHPGGGQFLSWVE